jgi:DNA-binding SARP family transcriptional activator
LFLDGFHLAGNDEFDRWVDAERSVFTQEHLEALEKLAGAADSRGDFAGPRAGGVVFARKIR